MQWNGSVGCYLSQSAKAEVLPSRGVDLSKDPDDTGDSHVFLSPRDTLEYLSCTTSLNSNSGDS